MHIPLFFPPPKRKSTLRITSRIYTLSCRLRVIIMSNLSLIPWTACSHRRGGSSRSLSHCFVVSGIHKRRQLFSVPDCCWKETSAFCVAFCSPTKAFWRCYVRVEAKKKCARFVFCCLFRRQCVLCPALLLSKDVHTPPTAFEFVSDMVYQ